MELLASFGFPDARREADGIDEDKVTKALAEALGLPYREDRPAQAGRPAHHPHALAAPSPASTPCSRSRGGTARWWWPPPTPSTASCSRTCTASPAWPSSRCSPPRPTSTGPSPRSTASGSRSRRPRSRSSGGIVDVGNLEQFVNLSGLDALEASSEPIVAAVEYLFHYAFEQRASDIHVEPRRDESIIRMRIDGVLHPVYRIPKGVHGGHRQPVQDHEPARHRRAQAAGRPHPHRPRRHRDGAARLHHAHRLRRQDRDPHPRPASAGPRPLRARLPARRAGAASSAGSIRPHGLVVVTGPTGSAARPPPSTRRCRRSPRPRSTS